MRKTIKRVLVSVTLILFMFMLQACKFSLPLPGLKTSKKNIPVESYERSTLDNIDSYENAYSYKDVHKMIYDTDGYMPSKGNIKVLVVPIKFRDVYTSQTNLEKYHNDLERTFFGIDTGYESLRTYYEKSSYGKLNISGEILDWYTPSNPSTYYENIYSNSNANIAKYLGELAMDAISAKGSEIDLSEYDYDNDGILDGVYLVCNKDRQEYDSLYWSWVTYYSGKEKIEGYKLYQLMWSNISFMYHDDFYNPVKGDNVNAITFIHETGHMMGSDDYYDYSPNEYKDSIFGKKLSKKGEGCNLGAGSYDMMDGNVGDHCANSKMLFGWITPYVATHDVTIEINKFSSSGDAIIVAPSFDLESGNLSEYFIIEYYDHNGLADQNIFDNRGYTESGIRIYHVNARVEKDNSYWSIFKYDNSYENHAFITLISKENNKKGKTDFIASDVTATNNSLFQQGDKFVPIDSNEYVNKLLLKVEITINSVNIDTANITITFKD